MTPDAPGPTGDETYVMVRYWASARAAAGTAGEQVALAGPTSLADLVAGILERHEPSAPLARVLGACSVLVGEQPVGTRAHAEVVVRPGDAVEFLPPFAGG